MILVSTSAFFNAIRSFFGGHLSQVQVTNMEALLTAALPRTTTLEAVAYILATVRHEAGADMKPVEEHGKGAGRDYGKKLDVGGGPGKRVAYVTPDKLFFGRGHVQLTWISNYRKMSPYAGVDLVANPEKMLDVEISAKVTVEGMVRGTFTGKKLADYFKPDPTHPAVALEADEVWARSIINGKRKGEKLPDQATLIAGYYARFLAALKVGHQAAIDPPVMQQKKIS